MLSPLSSLRISSWIAVILVSPWCSESPLLSQTSTDDAREVQSLVNRLSEDGSLQLESGRVYNFHSSVKLRNKNIIIQGNSCRIINHSSTDPCFIIESTGQQPEPSCLIENVVFSSDRKKPRTGGAILVARSFGTTIRNCSFFLMRSGYAVRTEQVENFRVESSRFDWNSVDACIEVLQSPHNSPFFANAVSIQNCRIQHCSGETGKGGYGIVASGANISIRDCVVNVCGRGGILLGRDMITYGVVIDNLYCESNSFFDIKAADRGGIRFFELRNITVRNDTPEHDGMNNISRNVDYSVDLQFSNYGRIVQYALTAGEPRIGSVRIPKGSQVLTEHVQGK